MSKTKVVGILMLVTALSQAGIDVLDGHGFNLLAHLDAVLGALGGLGLFFLRDAISKVIIAVEKIKTKK
jgi:hypothetical protein